MKPTLFFGIKNVHTQFCNKKNQTEDKLHLDKKNHAHLKKILLNQINLKKKL